MLGQFARQDQSNGRLDFSGRHGRLLVVSGQLGGFSRDLFENIVDEGVHDAHALLRDADLGVHLLQHTVDVGAVALDALLLGAGGGGLAGLLGGLLRGGLGHLDRGLVEFPQLETQIRCRKELEDCGKGGFAGWCGRGRCSAALQLIPSVRHE